MEEIKEKATNEKPNRPWTVSENPRW